jgi:hypothetical protein
MKMLHLLAASGLLFRSVATERSSTIAGREFSGETITADLPVSEQLRNRGGRDGAGMCVMTSIEMAARWQGIDSLLGLRDWCANEPGGAWPEKVDRQLHSFCRQRGIAVPAYLQYEGRNPESILNLCERTGRMACVTYGYSPRYGRPIAHMINCVKFGAHWAVGLDNNFPGDGNFEWMTQSEFLRRIKHPGGTAWIFVWLAPPPPPVPHN